MSEEEVLPRLLAKRYRLESRLGSGGMGVVYRATDTVMERQVAVKLVRSEEGIGIDEEVAGRFVREAKHTARIQHENIIEVFDLGRSERGDLFFAMELVEGESLASRLRSTGRFGPHSTVHIGIQICGALGVAHAHGIIHRDLKPANIMLVERAGDPDFVKVLDFGVAKSMGPDQGTALTQTGMLVGTVEYMSPEQIMAKGVDARSDVYSLGVVLYRMLTGKPPFRDAGVPAIIHSHLNLVPPALVQISPDVPVGLDRVVMRCLAKDPAARYQTMAELADALAEALDELSDPGGDPYGFGDRTEVARIPRKSDPDTEPRAAGNYPQPAAPARPAPAARQAPPAPRMPVPPMEDGLDARTVKLDRSASFPRVPEAPPAAPRPGFAGGPVPTGSGASQAFAEDGTLVLQDDVSTAKRSVPDEIAALRASQPRTCAMCQTVNAPHVRACVACGVSLAAEDQAQVRARVAAPRAQAPLAPPAPPVPGPPHAGISGAYPSMPQTFGHGAPGGHGPMAPPQPWGPPVAVGPSPRPSMWQRFLAWTGLGR